MPNKRWRDSSWRTNAARDSERLASCDLRLIPSLGSSTFWRVAVVIFLLKCVAVLLAWAAYSSRIPAVQAEIAARSKATEKMPQQQTSATKVEAVKQVNVLKLIGGNVSAVNAHGIAVEFAATPTSAQEMYFPFASKLTLQGASKVTDIHYGDSVVVEYQETSLKNERDESVSSRRIAVRVTLTKRATPPSAEQTASDSDEEEKPVHVAQR